MALEPITETDLPEGSPELSGNKPGYRRTRTGALMTGRHYEQLSDAASWHVRELILSGELVSGDFIRLDRLADELGISVTPVREGLLRLREMGMVDLAPRRGFIVRPFEPDDIRDLFIAQGLLGGELALRAARLMSDADIEELRVCHEKMERAAEANSADETEELNHRFHRIINVASQAPKIAALLRVGIHYVPSHFFSSKPEWVEASLREHGQILWGLSQREPVIARIKMNDHLVHAGELLANHLAERRRESVAAMSQSEMRRPTPVELPRGGS